LYSHKENQAPDFCILKQAVKVVPYITHNAAEGRVSIESLKIKSILE
jgi:hypothetical protein